MTSQLFKDYEDAVRAEAKKAAKTETVDFQCPYCSSRITTNYSEEIVCPYCHQTISLVLNFES